MAGTEPQPCIITVAITGSVPRKENNPAVPITVSEQVESTHAAFEAGAALVHVHVRNDDQSTTSNPDRFAEFQERIRPVSTCRPSSALRTRATAPAVARNSSGSADHSACQPPAARSCSWSRAGWATMCSTCRR